MIKNLIKSIFLITLLSAFLTVAASVSINPQNPRTNNDLSCYVNNVLCNTAGCNAHWFINNQPILINPILSSSYTSAGNNIECRTYISGQLQGSAFVKILNSYPVIQNIPDVSFNEDTSYTINLNNYVSDLDNDPITWTYSGNVNINIIINNGVATLTPNLNFNGQEPITFTASDNRGSSVSDQVLVTINPVNDLISLNDISNIYMNENTIYILDLTNYIVDPDGDLQDILVFGNSNINVNVNFSTRIVTFTPNANWFGQELITVNVMDLTSSDTDSFLVVVNEVNDAPVINSFIPNQLIVNINEGSSQIFSVVASDLDGDSLTYEWRLNNVVVGTGTNYMYNALDGPDTNTLQVRVSDGNSITTNTWTVNEINLNPAADANGPYSCMINTNIILRGSASDPGQETFLFEWDINNDGNYELSGQSVTINCGTIGNFPLTLRVNDGDNGFGTDNTMLTVTNSAVNNQPYFDPVLINQVAVVGQLFSYDIDAYDADGDVLTYSDNRAEFDINLNTGLISFIPLVVGLIPATITVCDNSGFPNACYSESFNLDVRATANNNPTVQILNPINGASFVLGTSITFSGSGNDPEDIVLTGSQLQWTSSINGNIGQGQTFSTNSLSAGTHIITLTGTDSGGASDTDSISITISVAPSQCSDGIDNDADGAIDLNDPGCSSAADNDETDPIVAPQCSDSIDNDADGAIDYPNDLGCVSAGDTNERESPVAVAGNDINTSVNTLVSFNGSASYDIDGTIVSYSWNFGDSTNGNGTNVQHSYSSAGTYNVILTVTDNNGLTDTDNLVVIVSSSGAGVSATTRFIDIEHKFEISEAKIISDIRAGEDVKILVELKNTGSFDEKINLRLKNNNLLLLKEFGDYEVEEGKTKLIYLTFKLAKDASGKYDIQLEAYNNNYETSKFIELDSNVKSEFISLLTGGVAGYDIIIEEESGVWVWTILILIILILISLGIKKIFK